MPGVPIACVRLEIGSLSGVSADSVRFCSRPGHRGHEPGRARLEISEVAARCRCGSCGQEFEPDGPVPLCPCGSPDAAVLSGGDMRILSVEVGTGTRLSPPAHRARRPLALGHCARAAAARAA